jgi:AbrB family looped-hinge helix DNA binding protein
MSMSVLTKKGQTTIPKDIRNFLNLAPNDKILYLMEGNKVVIKPLKGNILDLKGSVKIKDKPIDLKKLRSETKKKVARKIAQDR